MKPIIILAVSVTVNRGYCVIQCHTLRSLLCHQEQCELFVEFDMILDMILLFWRSAIIQFTTNTHHNESCCTHNDHQVRAIKTLDRAGLRSLASSLNSTINLQNFQFLNQFCFQFELVSNEG